MENIVDGWGFVPLEERFVFDLLWIINMVSRCSRAGEEGQRDERSPLVVGQSKRDVLTEFMRASYLITKCSRLVRSA